MQQWCKDTSLFLILIVNKYYCKKITHLLITPPYCFMIQQWCKDTLLFLVLIATPKFFYVTPFGVMTHSLKTPDIEYEGIERPSDSENTVEK